MLPIIGGTGGIGIVRRGWTAFAAARGGVGEKVACPSVGQISRAAITVCINAGDTLDTASVRRGGTGGDRDAELEEKVERGSKVVDGVVAIFDRGDQVV